MEETNAPARRSLWQTAKLSVNNWLAHKDAKAGAALAYYSIFSIGPLVVIVIALAGLVFGQEAVQREVMEAMKGLLGDSGAKAIDTMLAGANKKAEGIVATAIGTATLVFAAIGVVVQLKEALNVVWEVKRTPGKGLWGFARSYVFSFAAVSAVAFLLLISMLLSAGLAAAGKYLGTFLPEGMLHIAGSFVSFVVIAALFALMFKELPDAEISWRDVWLGAVGTAALFEIGKVLISLYIGKQGLESSYGAAASVVVILIWVYYSAQLVLLGAEFTRAWAQSAPRT